MEAESVREKRLVQDIMDFKVHFIAYIALKWIARCKKTQTCHFLHCRKSTHEDADNEEEEEKEEAEHTEAKEEMHENRKIR